MTFYLNLLVFSFNLGPIHIISISTEFYFYLEYGLEQIVQQYNWLEKDLQVLHVTCNKLMQSPNS